MKLVNFSYHVGANLEVSAEEISKLREYASRHYDRKVRAMAEHGPHAVFPYALYDKWDNYILINDGTSGVIPVNLDELGLVAKSLEGSSDEWARKFFVKVYGLVVDLNDEECRLNHRKKSDG